MALGRNFKARPKRHCRRPADTGDIASLRDIDSTSRRRLHLRQQMPLRKRRRRLNARNGRQANGDIGHIRHRNFLAFCFAAGAVAISSLTDAAYTMMPSHRQ